MSHNPGSQNVEFDWDDTPDEDATSYELEILKQGFPASWNLISASETPVMTLEMSELRGSVYGYNNDDRDRGKFIKA